MAELSGNRSGALHASACTRACVTQGGSPAGGVRSHVLFAPVAARQNMRVAQFRHSRRDSAARTLAMSRRGQLRALKTKPRLFPVGSRWHCYAFCIFVSLIIQQAIDRSKVDCIITSSLP